jgi:hypothetical protein
MTAIVTPHAERIPFEKGFSRVRLVAIDTTNSGGMHAAAEKGGKFVILLPHLSVRIVGVALIHYGEEVMIVEGIAWNEVASDLTSPGVA